MEPLQIGVCSWSLKMPDIGDALVAVKNELGLNLVQIGFWDEAFKQTDRIIKLIERHRPGGQRDQPRLRGRGLLEHPADRRDRRVHAGQRVAAATGQDQGVRRLHRRPERQDAGLPHRLCPARQERPETRGHGRSAQAGLRRAGPPRPDAGHGDRPGAGRGPAGVHRRGRARQHPHQLRPGQHDPLRRRRPAGRPSISSRTRSSTAT